MKTYLTFQILRDLDRSKGYSYSWIWFILTFILLSLQAELRNLTQISFTTILKIRAYLSRTCQILISEQNVTILAGKNTGISKSIGTLTLTSRLQISGPHLAMPTLIMVARGVLTLPILWRPPPILPSFFKFGQTLSPPPPPTPFSSPPTSTSTALFAALFLSMNGWSRHIWCVILLYIMNLHISNLGTLVPEGPCCVFYATRCQVYWGLTHNLVLC